MIGNFLRVPAKQVAALRMDPERITKVLYPQSDGDTQMSDDVHIDVDKAWHGIHFLLNGKPWEGEPPLDFIVGGKPLGDVDVGYGPARAFDADEVRAIAAALEPITKDVLMMRFDAPAMKAAEIYPNIGDDPPDDVEYLVEHYERLREFVLETAELGAGMIVYLN
jgi:hypothetical protein